MHIDKKNWLEHLNGLPEDIRGYKTCTYLVALEGWRRGLELKFHIRKGIAIPPSVRFSLSNGVRTHYFSVARGDKVSKEAISICSEKPETYKRLHENNIPIPEGKSFSATETDDTIINYAKTLDFPLVIKPTDGASGLGVITDIRSLEQFEEALKKVRYELGYKSIIVERFIKGEDYRVYVVDNKVIGAYKRLAANVIGDGESSIRELIIQKNKLRKKNPFIYNRPIVINKDLIHYLKENQMTLESVPEKGQRVILRKQGTYLKERDPIDITDEMPESIKEIAVKAMHSIPGLTHCDVDMLVNEETGEAYVNEINSRPQISNHLFPLEGKARDIPRAVIDYYFPETINGPRNDKLFFDFRPVYEAFRSMSVKEVVIPNIPLDHELTRFRMKGQLRGVGYERWMKRLAIRYKLNGYIIHLNEEETSIVVSGNTDSLERFRNVLHNEAPSGAIIESVREYNRTIPIVTGFRVKRKKKISKIRKDYEQLIKKHQKVLNELNFLQKKYDSILESKSWRLTKPLRSLVNGFRKIKDKE